MRKHILILTLVCGTVGVQASIAASKNTADPIKVQVCKRKEQTIRLSPNPSYNGTLAVVSESKAPLHFYVFDVEGTMMFNTVLKPGEKSTVSALKKGVYSYDVFRNDEGVEQGKITVL